MSQDTQKKRDALSEFDAVKQAKRDAEYAKYKAFKEQQSKGGR